VAIVNPADGSFTYNGEMTFAGTMEGCATGTVFFDVTGEGTTDASGVSTFTSNTFTAMPGGTLHLIATIDESGTEDQQGDGTTIMDYPATYSC
jgi:hypothetical protein